MDGDEAAEKFRPEKTPAAHPVLEKFPAFYDHTVEKFDLRVRKLGLSDRPLREIPWIVRAVLIGMLPIRTTLMRFFRPKRLLTKTYLNDAWIRASAAADASDEPYPR